MLIRRLNSEFSDVYGARAIVKSRGDAVLIRKPGSKIFKLSGDLLACSRVEVVGSFANIELVSKPARVEISTAEK